jgi:putative ABC transport system permease protein
MNAGSLDRAVMEFLDSPWNVLGAAAWLLAVILLAVFASSWWFYLRMIFKSLFRNILRSALTGLATFVFVLLVVNVWTVLYFLDLVTSEKTKDLKAIVTERWQIPSQMPPSYEASLSQGAKRAESDKEPTDFMSWTFVGGTLDPEKRTRENIVFFFGMDPEKLMKAQRDEGGALKRDRNGRVVYSSMMDGMDELKDEEIDLLDRECAAMKKNFRQVVLGKDRLAALNKKVGESFELTCLNYPGLTLEVEVIGEFPEGRYNQSALMNVEYFRRAMDDYKKRTGKPHPGEDKSLNLVWLRVEDTEAFKTISDQIVSSPSFASPAVKCETASSGVASFLDAYRSLLWGMRWLLVPAILGTMSLVIANAISISVRERRSEMAVLKVLGFGPNQILVLVLGEALLLGVVSGLLGALACYLVVNLYFGGLKFPVAFFPAFKIPLVALWWGPMLGAATAFAGSFMPAWSARSVKVAEVFSKVS